MRIAALLLAFVTIVVSMVGIIFPDTLTALRGLYYTPGGLYAAGAARVAMGLVLILAALSSRWPRTLQGLGAVVCLQGLAANLIGLDRARAILEWEAMHTALLRAGAVVALVTSGFVAFALTTKPSEGQRKLAH